VDPYHPGHDVKLPTLEGEMQKPERQKYWTGTIGDKDDYGRLITDEFIDGRTVWGPWAIMAPLSWREEGVRKLGTGYGQRYKKQADGRWLKVEG